MNYKEATEYLFNVTPVFEKIGAGAYKEGLHNTWALDTHFGHPHRRFRSIHVAGTNGKGSCSHTIAAVLQAAGYHVGLYTSPHLVDFRERIRVDGQCISEQYVIDFVEQERDFFEPLQPSFFELTTAMAYKYFAEQHVDFAVIEVGLGGRLDCTNIIMPVVSIITNISLDHTQFLGNSLAQIAAEKAGIIKPFIPVVVGETLPETRPVFAAKAADMGAPLHFAEEFDTTPYDGIDFELKGSYQEKNRRTILCALDTLQATLTKHPSLITRQPSPDGQQPALINQRPTFDAQQPTPIEEGFAHVVEMTGLKGRWQKIQERPLVICDTGHNVGGWESLAPQIKAQPCRQLRIVFGMVDDKDIDTVMGMLPKDAAYYWTQASTHRAIPAETVCQKGLAHGLQGTCHTSVDEAYRHALHDAAPDDFIFVGGSSYVVADLLSDLQ